ncbi:MAG: hypothetical protein AAGC57_12095 [Pseudomonadota bacterium]
MTQDTHDTPQSGGAWELIPWYVNGTLEDAERALVERAAEADPAIAAEIRQQKRVAEAMADLDAMDEAEERSWSSLAARIAKDAVPATPPEASPAGVFVPGAPEPGQTATVTHLDSARRQRDARDQEMVPSSGPTPWPLRLQRMPRAALAAGLGAPALIAAMLLAGIFWDPGSRQGAEYGTLTTETGTVGTVIRLRAQDGFDPATLEAAASEHGLAILSGPGETGVYTLRPAPDTDAQRAAEALGALPGIAFVVVREGAQ